MRLVPLHDLCRHMLPCKSCLHPVALQHTSSPTLNDVLPCTTGSAHRAHAAPCHMSADRFTWGTWRPASKLSKTLHAAPGTHSRLCVWS